MMRRNESQKGFTLLEVIVAFTIMGLMAGMIFASLRMALNAYDRSQVRIEERATERVLFDQVKRQIGSLFPLSPTADFLNQGQAGAQGQLMQNPLAQQMAAQAPLFYGEPDFVTFVTVAPLLLHENPGLTVVRYGLAQDEYGDYYLGAMETQYTGQESFLQMVDLPSGEPYPLVERVESLELSYYGYGLESEVAGWYQSWFAEEMNSVPLAIRLDFNDRYVLVQVNANSGSSSIQGGLRQFVQ